MHASPFGGGHVQPTRQGMSSSTLVRGPGRRFRSGRIRLYSKSRGTSTGSRGEDSTKIAACLTRSRPRRRAGVKYEAPPGARRRANRRLHTDRTCSSQRELATHGVYGWDRPPASTCRSNIEAAKKEPRRRLCVNSTPMFRLCISTPSILDRLRPIVACCAKDLRS